jgi:hypothetical protein
MPAGYFHYTRFYHGKIYIYDPLLASFFKHWYSLDWGLLFIFRLPWDSICKFNHGLSEAQFRKQWYMFIYNIALKIDINISYDSFVPIPLRKLYAIFI